jgi:MFS family permease
MSDQQQPQQDSYQFREYMAPSSFREQFPVPPTSGAGHPPRPGASQQPVPAPYMPVALYPYPGKPATSFPAPPVQAAPRQKKPLHLPLTRHALHGKQFVCMVFYSVLMIVLFAGNILAIAQASANQKPDNIFIHPDGTANGLLILVFSVFVLLVIPAMSLLCGALFSAAWAFVLTCIVEGVSAGVCIMYLSTQHIPVTISINTPVGALFFLLPITAALVGLCYDRRRYASWGKSFLSMLLGSAFFVIVLLALVAILGNPGSTSTQSTLTSFYIGIGCFGLLAIPLLALPIAGVESIIHIVLTARRRKIERNA